MDGFQSIILGIVQGLTEFLPISSSGHLVMAGTLLDVATPGVFVEVALHVGTLASVMIVYRARLGALALGALRGDGEAWRYIGLLLLASIPAAFVGLFLGDYIEVAFGAPWITGVMLIITGFVLWSTRRIRPAAPRAEDGGIGPAVVDGTAVALEESAALAPRTAAVLTWKLALVIGIAQAIAILPGISRSGSTIAAGLWGRLGGEETAEFSFLMSIIVIAGAAALQVREFGSAVVDVGATPLFLGFMTALVTGIIAIRSLVWLLRKQAFYAFAFYLWPVGTLFLIYLAIR